MAYIQPFQTPSVAKTTTPNPTSDYITIWEAASGQWKTINKETFIEDQIVRQATPFSGIAPAAKELGIDTSTGNFYFKNALGLWEAQPVGTTVNLIDNNDGTLTVNAGLGGTQKTIRPTNELIPNTTPAGTDQLAVLQAGEYKSLDLASLPVSTATQTALNLKVNSTDLTSGLATKENTIATGTTGQYYRGDKTFATLDKTSVGLASVDNTTDANKPISTAQAAINTAQTTTNADTATALGLKQDKSSFAVPSIVAGDATTTQKILITDQASTATNAINVDALFATTPLKNATGQIIMTAGNVRYGTTVPSVIAGTDNKNDTYIRTIDGLAVNAAATNLISEWVFDGTQWSLVSKTADAVIQVTGVTTPVTFPVTTLPGTPVFSPNTPATSGYIYQLNDGTFASWNGTQYVSSPAPIAPQDFFRSGTGTTLPDGTTDTTEKVSRIGQTGFGVVDASTIGATIDNFGTLTNRSVTISNTVASLSISAAQVDANSTLQVIQTVIDTTVAIASPVTSIAAGRFFSLHNDNTSTRNITYSTTGGVFTAKPGQFIDLQWNGNVWACEALPIGGNIINALSNVPPATVMNVGGLYEISMPASTDVQLRALVARQAYTLSEGEYPTGSFASGSNTGAVVNITTTFAPVDNNVHVANERNIITIQDVLTNRIFRVTVWRFGPITGNWSGWVEEIGITTNQIFTPTPKNYAHFTKNATLATSNNLNIPWDLAVANLGGEITQTGANITLTPTAGTTKTYKIQFDAKYTFNAVLAHVCDFRLRNPLGTAQIINGVSVAANAYFGQGTALFSATFAGQEAASGRLDFSITTSTPITFCAAVVGTTNTPTLGSTGSSRFPSIIIEEMTNIYSVTQTPIPLYATNADAVADVALATGSQYSVLVGGFKQIFVK